MRYFVTVRGSELVVDLDGDRVTVDGVGCAASLQPLPGTPLRQLMVNGRPRVLAVEPLGSGAWGLAWAGERWEADVVDERTRHIRSVAAAPDRASAGGLLKAPMPGLVVRLEVAPGQTVAPGGGVLVLEAMKMENELRWPAGGRVKAVLVQPGQAVEKGQLLVEFEGSR